MEELTCWERTVHPAEAMVPQRDVVVLEVDPEDYPEAVRKSHHQMLHLVYPGE